MRDNAAAWPTLLEDEPDVRCEDVGAALATSRTAFAHRAVVVADEREHLLDGLRSLAEDQPSAHAIEGVADVDLCADRPVFVFPGQGGQWAGMGVELLERSQVFAGRMRDVRRRAGAAYGVRAGGGAARRAGPAVAGATPTSSSRCCSRSWCR